MNRFNLAAVGMSLLLSFASLTTVFARDSRQEDLSHLDTMSPVIKSAQAPKLPLPQWYEKQLEAEKVAQAAASQTKSSGGSHAVDYTVTTRGATSSNLGQFSSEANQTLNDARGWGSLGIKFSQVPSGGSFTLALTEPAVLDTIPGCSSEWSCRAGGTVYINDARWKNATASWNAAGGSIRDYRHMVVNHEVGHWLGHGHQTCPSPNAPAPLMQQQSISLQGCAFNPWPLASERWLTQLGITW